MEILKNKLANRIILTMAILFLVSISLSTVNAVDINLNDNDVGGIKSAIANVSENGSTVTNNTLTLNPGIYNKTTDRNNYINFNNMNLTIKGNGPTDSVIIGAQKFGRIFQIPGNSNITFINITFTNGNITGFGGAIDQTGTGSLNIDNCLFNTNTASHGGAINGKNSHITNSSFNNNTANILFGVQLSVTMAILQ